MGGLLSALTLRKTAAVMSLALLATFIFAACGGDEDASPGPTNEPSLNATSTSESAQQDDLDGVRLEKLSVFDPAAGGEAFTMLKPTGWQAQGGIAWRHDLANLASSAMAVYNPDGFEALETFPLIPFTWQEGGVPFFPPGTIYLGSYVKPPIFEPVDFVAQVVIPSHRANVNAQIIEWEEVPAVAEQVAALVQEQGLNKTVRASRVRIGYTLNGVQVHEDFYLTLVYTTSPFAPGILWGPERLYSFRAPAGELDEVSPLMHTMVSSTRVNRQWLNQYIQVTELRHQGQMQAIQSAGELSHYLAQVNDEISDIITQTYQRQQAANDRIYQDFSELIRGTETYDTPYDEFDVELPSGFDEVWASETGEFILSNDPNFDPNARSTVNWQLLRER